MKKFKTMLLLGLMILQFSCNKDEFVEPNPQMLISVVSNYMGPVPGATITLYNSKDEFYLKENPKKTVQTDSNGQALFENLKEQRYYFYVEKDGLDNSGDISATWNSLQFGKRSELVVKIAEPIEF